MRRPMRRARYEHAARVGQRDRGGQVGLLVQYDDDARTLARPVVRWLRPLLAEPDGGEGAFSRSTPGLFERPPQQVVAGRTRSGPGYSRPSESCTHPYLDAACPCHFSAESLARLVILLANYG